MIWDGIEVGILYVCLLLLRRGEARGRRGAAVTARLIVEFKSIFLKKLLLFFELACHVIILYYFNKTFNLISIFHPSLNGNDHFN